MTFGIGAMRGQVGRNGIEPFAQVGLDCVDLLVEHLDLEVALIDFGRKIIVNPIDFPIQGSEPLEYQIQLAVD
jgi:hypothetical protein